MATFWLCHPGAAEAGGTLSRRGAAKSIKEAIMARAKDGSRLEFFFNPSFQA